jgi:hypothetical protein
LADDIGNQAGVSRFVARSLCEYCHLVQRYSPILGVHRFPEEERPVGKKTYSLGLFTVVSLADVFWFPEYLLLLGCAGQGPSARRREPSLVAAAEGADISDMADMEM